jgi:TonB family protein
MIGARATTMSKSKRRLSAGLLAVFATLPVLAQDDAVVEYVPGDEGERVPLHTVVPLYPEKARRARVEGEVEVCFKVDRQGRTSHVAVRRSTNRAFEKPARDAVKQSTYKPLAEDQELSGIKTCRTFRFRLTRVAAEESAS